MAGRKPTVSDEEILRQIVLSPDPIVTAKEVSNQIGMTPQGALNRLEDLEDEDLVSSKKVGAAARVFWPTDRGRQLAASGGQSSESQ